MNRAMMTTGEATELAALLAPTPPLWLASHSGWSNKSTSLCANSAKAHTGVATDVAARSRPNVLRHCQRHGDALPAQIALIMRLRCWRGQRAIAPRFSRV